MSRTCLLLSIGTGIFFILFGIVSFTTLAPMTMQLVIEKFVLNVSPGSRFVKSFANPSANSSKMHIYMFEMMNSRDFLTGSKPRLRELGPFVFRTEIQRFNFTFSDNNRKLTYFQRYLYHFDKDSSVADLSQPITTVNFPLNMILSRIDKMSSSGLLGIVQPMVKNFIKESLRNDGERILERRTVGQILVGRPVDFIRRVQGYIDLAKSFGLRLGFNLEMMKKIGYFRTTNNSVIGPITIKTGKRSFGAFFREYSVRNNDNLLLTLLSDDSSKNTRENQSDPMEYQFLEAYSDRGNRFYEQGQFGSCNERRGTDGTAFNIYAIREQRSLFLNTPFCRAMKLKFWNYSTPTETDPELANYVFEGNIFHYDRENWCYCSDSRSQKLSLDAAKRYRSPRTPRNRVRRPRAAENKNGEPVLDSRRCDGVYDYSQCQKNAAVYLSFPYFANAPALAANIEGWNGFNGRTISYSRTLNGISSRSTLNTEKEDDPESEHDFEPQFSLHKGLGVPFKVRFQLQFNVKVTPSMTNGGRKKSMYLPFLWFEQRFDLADNFKAEIKTLDSVTSGAAVCSLLFSVFGALLMIVSFAGCFKSDNKSDKIKNDKESLPDLARKTKNKVKELVNDRLPIQQLKIDNLRMNKNNSGSSSSLTKILPRTESRDSERNRHREYSLKNKKAGSRKNNEKKLTKLSSAQDKFHDATEGSNAMLTPLE